MSIYHKNDLGFDLEIRGNFFVNSQIYPDQKKVIVSYLEQITDTDYPEKTESKPKLNKVINNNEETDIINDQDTSRLKDASIKSNNEKNNTRQWHQGFLQKYYDNGINDYQVENINLDKAEKRIRSVVDAMSEKAEDDDSIYNYTIQFENLATLDGLLSFIQRYGIATKNTLLNKTKLKQKLKKYKVVYDTDDNYDKESDGIRIGYNSINYDETMIAYLIGEINENIAKEAIAYNNKPSDKTYKKLKKLFYNKTINKNNGDVLQSSPEELTKFNTIMFNQKYMNNALGMPWEHPTSTSTYKAWNISNRFIDVSKLNPKPISLKRCAMALGYKIQESDTNRNPTAPLKTLDQILDLIAYNVNDIYVTLKVFESKEYMNRYNQNKQLLKEFPYVIYEQTAEAKKDDAAQKIQYVTGQDHIRKDRLTVNSTSTQIVTFAIAPYPNTKIKDNKTLNLNFPDAKIAKKLDEQGLLPKSFHGKPRNVLDYVQDLLNNRLNQSNVNDDIKNKIKNQYQKIRKFYSQYIGYNFNSEITDQYPEIKTYEVNNKIFKQDHTIVRYITPYGNYIDSHKRGIASYVTLSLGGTHGVEVQQGQYDQAVNKYEKSQSLINDAIKYFNTKPEYNDIEINKDNLPHIIAKLKPDEAFTKVKRSKLPFNEKYTYGDIVTKTSSHKHCALKKASKPTLFTSTGALSKKYKYASFNWSNHADFSSYYPSLISKLAIFRNADGHDIFTTKLYEPRLKMKHLAKDKNVELKERTKYALRQGSMKLIINAASGGGDATFPSNIKCNNKMKAMRIIGQIFCWYIGQSLALSGARIPSTNTDGLYSMSLNKEENNKIVIDCAKELLLKIGPEYLPLFVSKDANNRLEKNENGVSQARGSGLTSWQGPSTQNSVPNPTIIDYVLSQYLGFKEDAVNQDFDKEFAKKIFINFITKTTKFNPTKADMLRFFQFPMVSNAKTGRFYYESNIKDPTKYKLLNATNRVFLVKDKISDTTIKMTGLQVIQPKSAKKNNPDGKYFRDVIDVDPIANLVIKTNFNESDYNQLLNGLLPKTKITEKGTTSWVAEDSKDKPRNIQNTKISDFKNNEPVIVYNEDLHHISDEKYNYIIKNLDLKEYLNMVESKFNSQWKNTNNDIEKNIKEFSIEK